MLANVLRGLRSMFRSNAVDAEMDEELNSFVEASTEDKLRRGMPIEQAMRAARVEMGSTNAVKHRIRSAGWEAQAEILWHDLKHGMRTLWRSPGFTLIAVLSLALGIGGNTAIFTLINQVLLQSLPVRDPQQLVTFGKSTGGGILGGIDLGTADMFTYDFARQLETDPGPFQGVAAYSSFSPKVNVRVPNSAQAIQISASLVSGNFFSVLGATPLLGRAIAPLDADAPDRSAVALVSYRFWQQSLSADPAILGKAITINATPFTVIGVMPQAFHGIHQQPDPPDLWVPVTMVQEVFLQSGMLRPRGFYILHMFARRAPQSSLATDQNWLDRQIRDYVRAGGGGPISPARRQEIERLTVRLMPAAGGVSDFRSQYGDSLVILMAIVAVVLLIACANLANFLLARAVARQREIATRLALGSSRARIVGHSVIEALLLSLCGGLFGLGVAFAVTRALIAFVTGDALFTPLDPHPDATVLLFTFGVSILAGLLFGLAPAMHIVHATASASVITNSRTAHASGGQSRRWWQKMLVATQIMLCLTLLVGAGLFLRTLHNLQDQDFGFERSHMLIADFDARIAGYKPEQVPALNQRLLDRLAAIPGVRSAALAATPPVSGGSWTSSLSISRYTPRPQEDMGAVLNRVSGDYFDAAGISILAGRPIQPSDTASTLKVAVVNQSFARHYFPKGNIIGHTLKIDIGQPGPWLVVGIAHDTRSGNPREDAPRTVYMPLAQIAGARGEGGEDSYAWVMILRTNGDAVQTIPSLKAAVAGIDPNLPILHMRTIHDQMESLMSNETLISRLTVVFAGLAVLLAAIGLYGVMSFNVARRTGEIGVRIALGATGSGVQWMILRESLVLLGAGLGLGLPITLFVVQWVRSQLYRLSPFDPAIFVAAAVGIALATLVSAWLPARRAAAVDPMTALRCD
ncbi:MAG TPA: ABC transporter permease [Acidobacteriaceae bacterium]|nr:ABC transporter permease [Acidobacteriaceae bacterium]